MENHRLIPLQGAGNFRDIGGLAGEQGRVLQRGLLYRSDDLSQLTPKDVAKLEQIGLRLVVDMRTPNESKGKLDRLPASPVPRFQQMPFYHPRGDFSSRDMLVLMLRQARRLDFKQFIVEYYHDIVFSQSRQMGEIFTLMCDPANHPALVHCTAGKDRTGILAALVQLLAGVPRPVVIEDYLESNHLSAARMRILLRTLRWISLFQISPERIQPALEVRREYLETILDEIYSTYGGVEGYLIQACGVDPVCLARLKGLLLVEGKPFLTTDDTDKHR